MMPDCRPIGFFDSGVGGISVLKTAYDILPHENYIYYGDNANAPYGEKSEEEIKTLSLAAGRFLYEKGVKAILIACNTATSAAVKIMREEMNIPVISMEPAVRPATAALKDGKALVLATLATVSQERYLGLVRRLGVGDKVLNVGCTGLVELIEEGRTTESDVHDYLEDRLSGIRNENIEAAVIGCTHYSFISGHIKSYIDKTFGIDCPVFDGRHGTVNQLTRILQEMNMLCGQNDNGRVDFFTSGDTSSIITFINLFNNFN